MHPFCPDWQLRPANPGNVLARSRDHVHDCHGWRRAGSAHLFARGRPKDSSKHRPARFNSADHHGWRAHQIRGHESEPRSALFPFALVLRTSERGQEQEDGEQAAGSACLSIHRHALVVRRDDCRTGQAQSPDAAAGSRATRDRRARGRTSERP